MEGQERNLSCGRPRLAQTSASSTRGVMFKNEPKFKTKTEWTNEARESEFNMSSNQIQNKQKLLTKNQNKAKRHRPNPAPPAHGQGRRGRRPGPPWATTWAAVEEGPSLQCFVSPFQLPIRSKD